MRQATEPRHAEINGSIYSFFFIATFHACGRRHCRCIRKLSPHLPISDKFDTEMPGGSAEQKRASYSSQRQHWLGWLGEHDGTGAYGRKEPGGQEAEFVYNHVVNQGNLLYVSATREYRAMPEQGFSH
jgi:hypothetical protein